MGHARTNAGGQHNSDCSGELSAEASWVGDPDRVDSQDPENLVAECGEPDYDTNSTYRSSDACVSTEY